jgi:deoxyribodipyrimidine photolyase-related protein
MTYQILLLTPQTCIPKKTYQSILSQNQIKPNEIYFIEHPYLFGLRPKTSGGLMKFHPFKWILLRAAGSYFRRTVLPKTHHFVEFAPTFSLPTSIGSQKKNEEVEWVILDHDDHDFQKSIEREAKKHKVSHITWISSPLFILNREEVDSYPVPKDKRLSQTTFYQRNRKAYDVLMTSQGKPEGGKWTYDTENREPLPPNHPLPKVKTHHVKSTLQDREEAIRWVSTPEIQKYISAHGHLSKEEYGEVFWCPVSPEEANHWLKDFWKTRFVSFGKYQDGITKRTEFPFLFHSALSSSLNVGLLNPLEVIRVAESKTAVSLAAREGFIRQILGWREFERLIYHRLGETIRKQNYFRHTRRISPHWYKGTTGIAPLDDAIYMAFRYGYLHHILRLMVVSNLMNLSQIHPDDVYRWFMEFAVDSWDWVMVGNVYSMGLYADGGLTTTKVYISSSHYTQIRESNYEPARVKKTEKETEDQREKWPKVWDSLYWNMIGSNPDVMKAMGRFGPIQYKYWEKKSSAEKKDFQQTAQTFIQNNTSSS